MKITHRIFYVLLTSLVIFSSCCEEQNADKPSSAISYARASQLQQEYIETRANFLNAYLTKNHFTTEKEGNSLSKKTSNKVLPQDGIGLEHQQKPPQILVEEKFDTIQDVRDVTFSIETLKQYIAYVEKEAKAKGLQGLGLRVYLGAYPKKDTVPEVKTKGYTTVFFMPTHQPKPELGAASSFFYWNDDEVINDVDGLNFGHSGKPPKDL